MLSIYGLQIEVSHARIAKKLVLPRCWHRGRAYARRVQKKWLKRFGDDWLVPNDAYWHSPRRNVVLMNPEAFDRLKLVVASQAGKAHG